jgi:four helix bundle protein
MGRQMGRFNFENLDVYREAVEFAVRIYVITKNFPKEEWFGIVSQLRRACISVPSNISEGSSRTKKEFIHFLSIALGSVYECVPLIEISKRREFIDQACFDDLYAALHRISAKISALKRSLSVPAKTRPQA